MTELLFLHLQTVVYILMNHPVQFTTFKVGGKFECTHNMIYKK